MSRGRHTFKQSDLIRALRSAKAAGIEISRIKISNTGEIEIDAGKPKAIGEVSEANEWDRV